jgi:segregation and condensation protein B
MNTEYTRKVIEAGMLAAGRTLSLVELANLFDIVDRPDTEQLRAALAELADSYTDRGIELKETAQGFRVQVRREFSEQVSRLWPERPPRYSRALLETLAIIAYRQPLTRAEIEGVRGVAVNPNIVKTLMERNWIRVVGNREVPGRPELLGTTRDFLDYFGLRTLDQLPPLSELKSLEELDPQLALPEPLGTQVANGEDAPAALPAPANEDQVEEAADEHAPEEPADEPEPPREAVAEDGRQRGEIVTEADIVGEADPEAIAEERAGNGRS